MEIGFGGKEERVPFFSLITRLGIASNGSKRRHISFDPNETG